MLLLEDVKNVLRVVAPVALFVLACNSGSSSPGSSTSDDDPTAPNPVAGGDGGASTSQDGSSSSSSSGGGSENGETEEIDTGPPALRFIGRFDTSDPAGPKCSWPGCRIIARFEGTSVSVRLREFVEPWMVGAPSEWDVAVDGQWKPKIVTVASGVETEFSIATDLPSGIHTVELYKRSEAQNGTTQFLGYDFEGGTLLPPPKRKERRIEIVGDSQPAAFGVEGVGLGPDCPGEDHAAMYQNFRKSFGAHLGTIFKAEVQGTVFSGKGFAKNIWRPDTETMPVVFHRTNPLSPKSSWEFSWSPNVAIVMMGANDFDTGKPIDEGQATVEEFNAAFASFIEMLRGKYPDTYLMLAVSPSITDTQPPGRNIRTNVTNAMTSVTAQRNAAGDTKVWTFAPKIATASELTGCNGHGNPKFHERVANELAAEIKTKLGW